MERPGVTCPRASQPLGPAPTPHSAARAPAAPPRVHTVPDNARLRPIVPGGAGAGRRVTPPRGRGKGGRAVYPAGEEQRRALISPARATDPGRAARGQAWGAGRDPRLGPRKGSTCPWAPRSGDPGESGLLQSSLQDFVQQGARIGPGARTALAGCAPILVQLTPSGPPSFHRLL